MVETLDDWDVEIVFMIPTCEGRPHWMMLNWETGECQEVVIS